ncbi:hypothetical protein L3X38_032591 [Prunus dulcis]|uniref:Uncharacterized protein n=1 Tax=Prunus dulcis TaxID=3755 RepID=A0AAD4VEA2_PRUDU|nr:hypothetical protein L3X38_032591 [Prunus dulcis]
MGNEPGLPSFDLEPLPKLLLSMEELFLAYAEDIDFVAVWRQKKEAFGEMYMTIAREDKKVALARRQMEVVKAATVEAHATIRKKNALQLKTNRFERELKETKKKN